MAANTLDVPWHGREVLLATLSELGLSRRLQNALKDRKCSLVGQLVQISGDELFGIPALGIKTIMDAERVLSDYSLAFGTPLPGWNQDAALAARKLLASQIKEKLACEPQLRSSERVSEFLLATLEEAGLPQRIINVLPKHGCELVGQLVQWSEAQLLSLDNLGAGSISEARMLLRKHGLAFGTTLENWTDEDAFERRQHLLMDRQAELPLQDAAIVPSDVPEEILLASLEEIGLPKRFLNHLPPRGCRLIGQVIQKTEAELFRLPNLGRRSVYEAREILASFGLSFGLTVPDWSDQAAMARRATLGDQIRQAVFDAHGESSNTHDLLEDEARRVFAAIETRDRNVDLLMSLFGFDGLPPKTLEAVGQTHGLTRERVRQISDRAQVKFSAKWRPTPRLDAAIQLLQELEPVGVAHFSELLIQRGIVSGAVHPQAIIEFAEFTGKKTDVRQCAIGGDEVYCRTHSEKLIQECVRELRRATSAMGCTSLDRLAVAVGVPLQQTCRIQAILETLSETIWLGRARNWAMSSRPTRNRVANMAEKIFSVTECITLPELRRCLSRSYRLPTVPAADALTDLLELKGLAVGEGDSVRRLQAVSTDCLGSIDLAFFLAFQELGNPLSREQLEDVCIDRYGVHPTSFWISLSYSPIVVKLAPGVYSLAGSEVPAGAVESVRLRTKANQMPSEHGWTQKGELWCVTQLDRGNVRSGNRAIPAYVARLTQGDWTCSVSGGLPAGSVSIEDGFARGFSLAFNLAGAENGDLARFNFDLRSRSVELRVGGNELTEDAAIGPAFYDEVEDESEIDFDDPPPAP